MLWFFLKRNLYLVCLLWIFWGGKLLMDFKIIFKRDGKWLKLRVFSKNFVNCKFVNSVIIFYVK